MSQQSANQQGSSRIGSSINRDNNQSNAAAMYPQLMQQPQNVLMPISSGMDWTTGVPTAMTTASPTGMRYTFNVAGVPFIAGQQAAAGQNTAMPAPGTMFNPSLGLGGQPFMVPSQNIRSHQQPTMMNWQMPKQAQQLPSAHYQLQNPMANMMGATLTPSTGYFINASGNAQMGNPSAGSAANGGAVVLMPQPTMWLMSDGSMVGTRMPGAMNMPTMATATAKVGVPTSMDQIATPASGNKAVRKRRSRQKRKGLFPLSSPAAQQYLREGVNLQDASVLDPEVRNECQGEKKIAITFDSYGHLGKRPQRMGNRNIFVPEGAKGRFSKYAEDWAFEVAHSKAPIVCEDGRDRYCVTWIITHVASGDQVSVTETPREARTREKLGRTICNKVFREALEKRRAEYEKLAMEARNNAAMFRRRPGGLEPNRIANLEANIATLANHRFAQGPLVFGLFHRELQIALNIEWKKRVAENPELQHRVTSGDEHDGVEDEDVEEEHDEELDEHTSASHDHTATEDDEDDGSEEEAEEPPSPKKEKLQAEDPEASESANTAADVSAKKATRRSKAN